MSHKAEREKQVLQTLEQLQQQIEQQEQLLNEVLVEIKKDPLPSLPQSSKSPFSMLENLDLDMEKLTKIALFISSLYNSSNEDKSQSSRDK